MSNYEESLEVLRKLFRCKILTDNSVKEMIKRGDEDMVKLMMLASFQEGDYVSTKEMCDLSLEYCMFGLCGLFLSLITKEQRFEFFYNAISGSEGSNGHLLAFILKEMDNYDVNMERIFSSGLKHNDYRLVNKCLHIDKKLIRLASGSDYSDDMNRVLKCWKVMEDCEEV